jgi:L-fuconolactonase
MPRTVDAHHHLWHYNPREFDWLQGPLAPLCRDFLVDDLGSAMRSSGIDAAVAVQARQTMEESRWLLQVAANTPEIAGVVGWAPLASPDLPEILETLLPNTHLKGLRHVLQGEPNPNYMLRADFNRGIASLLTTGLVYDILIFERHLPQTIEFVDRHPRQTFVLDHIAKPRIAESVLEPWANNLKELARRPNVFCKLSGLVTEADPLNWTSARLVPYLSTAADAFGPMRLMAGSDWPVCLAGVTYDGWFRILRDFFSDYTAGEQAAIFGETATRVYSLT